VAESFGQMVYHRRENVLHWTQKELAKRVDLDQSTISSIERDQTTPRSATITRLAMALGFDAAPWLVFFGHLPPSSAPPPPPPIEGDRPFDPAQIVAYVENKPDPRFQAQLARAKARRTPERYERLCLRIYRAWSSNADLVMDELAAIEME
jgi:transcriptional regulator with XRE-family HTH domain